MILHLLLKWCICVVHAMVEMNSKMRMNQGYSGAFTWSLYILDTLEIEMVNLMCDILDMDTSLHGNVCLEIAKDVDFKLDVDLCLSVVPNVHRIKGYRVTHQYVKLAVHAFCTYCGSSMQ